MLPFLKVVTMVVNDIEENGDAFIEKIRIYPNPNNGSFIIELNVKRGNSQLNFSMIDITGRVVHSGIIYSNEESKEINTSNLNDGIYFIKINSDQENYIKKVLIKK